MSRAVVKIVPIVPPSGSDAVHALAQGTVELQPPGRVRHRGGAVGRGALPGRRLEERTASTPGSSTRRASARATSSASSAGARLDGTVALTLDAAGTSARAPERQAARRPRRRDPGRAPPPDAVADPDIRAWFAREGAPPNWWAALGHDAALLARRAVAALPLDADESTRRRSPGDALAARRGARRGSKRTSGRASARVLPARHVLGRRELDGGRAAPARVSLPPASS